MCVCVCVYVCVCVCPLYSLDGSWVTCTGSIVWQGSKALTASHVNLSSYAIFIDCCSSLTYPPPTSTETCMYPLPLPSPTHSSDSILNLYCMYCTRTSSPWHSLLKNWWTQERPFARREVDRPWRDLRNSASRLLLLAFCRGIKKWCAVPDMMEDSITCAVR